MGCSCATAGAPSVVALIGSTGILCGEQIAPLAWHRLKTSESPSDLAPSTLLAFAAAFVATSAFIALFGLFTAQDR